MSALTDTNAAIEVATAWGQLVQSMTPSLGLEASDMGKLPPALRIIENHDLAEHAVAWFIEAGSTMVAEETAQKFWGCFDGFDEVKNEKGAAAWATERFTTAIEHAHAALCFQLQVASVLEAQLGSQYGVVSRCRANFTAVLFGSVPDHFYQVLYLFFERQFNEFGKVAGQSGQAIVEEDEEMDVSGELRYDAEDASTLSTSQLVDESMSDDDEAGGGWSTEQFRLHCSRMHQIGALPVAEEVFTEMLYTKIQQRIQHMAAGTFDKPLLPKVTPLSSPKSPPRAPLLSPQGSGEAEAGAGSARAAEVEPARAAEWVCEKTTESELERKGMAEMRP